MFNKIICIVLTTQESSVAPFERTKKRKGKGLRWTQLKTRPFRRLAHSDLYLLQFVQMGEPVYLKVVRPQFY